MKLLYLSLFAALVATGGLVAATSDDPTKSLITTHSSLKTTKADSTLTCNCTDGSTGCNNNGTCDISDTGMCVSVGYETGTSEKQPEQFKTCHNRSAKFDACKESYMFINTAGDEFYLRSNTMCCNDHSLCNEGAVTVQKENTTMSNWSCPSCFSDKSKSCDTRTLNCTESQDLCIHMTGKVMPGSRDFVIKGCATSTAAVLKEGAELHQGKRTFSIESSHTRHAGTSRLLGSVSFAILSPTLVVLLLGKFLY